MSLYIYGYANYIHFSIIMFVCLPLIQDMIFLKVIGYAFKIPDIEIIFVLDIFLALFIPGNVVYAYITKLQMGLQSPLSFLWWMISHMILKGPKSCSWYVQIQLTYLIFLSILNNHTLLMSILMGESGYFIQPGWINWIIVANYGSAIGLHCIYLDSHYN